MAKISFIMACLCGAEFECKPEDQALGSVWQCPKCQVVTACVRPHGGGKAWITVQPSQVEIYSLLKEPETESITL